MRYALRWTLLLSLLVALPSLLVAQRMGGARFGGSIAFRGNHFHHEGFRGGFYPLGYFDPLYSDYLPEHGYAPPSQPQVIVLQSPQPAPVAEPAAPPSQPLMIELQGDRYVQVSGDTPSSGRTINPRSRSSLPRFSTPNQQANPGASTVLVFRDGHQQPVAAYMIVGGTLYAGSDYATTGSWNQRIELSALNLPETIATNSATGQSFHVPSSPNEVIVGP